LEDARRLLQERNRGEHLQRLIGESLAATRETGLHLPRTGDLTQSAKQTLESAEIRETIDAIRTITILLVRSNDFRTLLVDLLHMLRDRVHTITREKKRERK
jgi:hypothetical protein